ncbi:MAG TPA: acetyl-CoA hydrolase/transferase C-terminal domain-containing protein [Deltaproteobacteria bacterium]|nr:acetyl-CoA hydrolase/transferase C-terminal domain-containing protein [Deltaproteobacteria bacterium]
MKRCTSAQAACADAIDRLGRDIFVVSPLGIGAGNQYLNGFARQAKEGRINLSVLTALALQVPEVTGGMKARLLNPIFQRVYRRYTTFTYIDECLEAKKNGTPMPDYLKFYSFYFFPGFSTAAPDAQLDYTPINFRDVNEALRMRGANVVAMKAAYRHGRFNCGTNTDIMTRTIRDVKSAGGVVMLIETDDMPYCHGDGDIPEAMIDYVIESKEPLYSMPHQPLSVVEHAIGSYAAELIPDGATLQIGIGQMADAVGFWLKRLGRTGINGVSEMISPAFMYLIKNGVITRRNEKGALVTGSFVVGSEELFRYVDDNPDFYLTSVHDTNNLDVIAKLPLFHAVNSTLQMDLFTQCASEGLIKGSRFMQYTGMGGQFEFQESAMKSPGGKSILCLRSAYRNEKGVPEKSNIVPLLSNVIGVPRNKMDYIVTEYGWRRVGFATISDRAKAAIELADSAFQKELLASARTLGIVDASYTVPEACRNNTYSELVRKFGAVSAANVYPLGLGIALEAYATEAERSLIRAGRDCAGMLMKAKLLWRLRRERDWASAAWRASFAQLGEILSA